MLSRSFDTLLMFSSFCYSGVRQWDGVDFRRDKKPEEAGNPFLALWDHGSSVSTFWYFILRQGSIQKNASEICNFVSDSKRKTVRLSKQARRRSNSGFQSYNWKTTVTVF